MEATLTISDNIGRETESCSSTAHERPLLELTAFKAQKVQMENKVDKLSNAASLMVLEIDRYPHELVPAFLLANLMSPSLWAWRSEKRAHSDDGKVLSAKNRLNQLQRFFHHYTFVILPDKPGGDLWGLLNFS